MPRLEKTQITTEKLANWYLRLNGFLTIQNFIVHPDEGGEQRTEADIIGVRFPYRSELSPRSMIDAEEFTKCKDKPYLIFAEATTGRCKLNGPWTKPEKMNLQRVLRAIGVFSEEAEIETAAKDIYVYGVYSKGAYHVSYACFGLYRADKLSEDMQNVPQITWRDAKEFIWNRFKNYRRQKSSHQQWDEDGRNLWDCWETHRTNLDSFIAAVKVLKG